MIRPGRPPVDPDLRRQARWLRAAGRSYGQIGKELGIGKTTAYEAVAGKRIRHAPHNRRSPTHRTKDTSEGENVSLRPFVNAVPRDGEVSGS